MTEQSTKGHTHLHGAKVHWRQLRTMKIKEGDKVVIKTRYANGSRARLNYPYQPEEIKKMQSDPMVVVSVSEAPDSVYVDVKSYLGRPMIQEHGHMWFLASDLDVVQLS